MHDTLTLAFGAAALLVIAGLYLVNKPEPKVMPDPNVLAIVTNAQWNAVDAMATTEERGFSRKTELPAFADDDGRKSVSKLQSTQTPPSSRTSERRRASIRDP